ncbi:intercellular adhesion molecule 2 [Rhinolophus ferrumequinum]|uniref:Intercellular adhesion molecule 2 n=2 Tax=Rhinolophus ferrumequinum TaxID=59479 RepID=A0A671FBN8_RHIFE|nr:intercellular adhesion molecule 2 isoform X1 [Rhinolophus ferrumequinum]KAF6298725.1 intercellular adhesion molecule 2 [Rhinolophus ferrumequinum]
MPGNPRLFPASLWTLLEMAPYGCWGLPVALLTLLCCPGSGEKTFKVYMCPEEVVVKRGESQKINCSTSCPQPEAGGLETTLSKELLHEQAQWKLFLVSNVSHNTLMHCYFTCGGKQMSKTANVSVFYPPKEVLLKLQPTWVNLGGSFTIECRVPDVVPLEKLTLTLLHGNRTLHKKTFAGATAGLQEALTIHNTTAHREDGNHNFSCKAELDLKSLGQSSIWKVSEPQMLKVHVPWPDNQMVIIITVVSMLLFLFVTSILLCFIFGQQWHQRRRGVYGVQAAWRSLRRAYRVQAA